MPENKPYVLERACHLGLGGDLVSGMRSQQERIAVAAVSVIMPSLGL